jgi:hypothetical protein
MWYFMIKASPKPNTGKDAGGAYANCWINFPIQDGAEHLAKFYLEKEGWLHEKTQDAKWVERRDYDDDPQKEQYVSEAEGRYRQIRRLARLSARE